MTDLPDTRTTYLLIRLREPRKDRPIFMAAVRRALHGLTFYSVEIADLPIRDDRDNSLFEMAEKMYDEAVRAACKQGLRWKA